MIPKFRAWMKSLKWMCDVTNISFDSKFLDICHQGDTERYTEMSVEFDEIELIQSTGLFDKNGKEIFEGDIITTNAYACIVCFGEYTYFEDEDTQTTAIGFYLSFLNVTPATYAPFEKCYWDNCKVIGNIHENELDLIMYEA